MILNLNSKYRFRKGARATLGCAVREKDLVIKAFDSIDSTVLLQAVGSKKTFWADIDDLEEVKL